MANDLYLGCGYQSEQGHGYAAFCLYDFKIYYYEFVYIIYFGFLEGMYDMRNPTISLSVGDPGFLRLEGGANPKVRAPNNSLAKIFLKTT